MTSGPPIAQIYLTLYHGVWWSNKFQYCPEVALIWSCFLFVAVCLSLVRWCNPMNSLAILPIASGLPKIQHPVAITWIANIEVLIAGGLQEPERALFVDCGAPRGEVQRVIFAKTVECKLWGWNNWNGTEGVALYSYLADLSS